MKKSRNKAKGISGPNVEEEVFIPDTKKEGPADDINQFIRKTQLQNIILRKLSETLSKENEH